MSLSVREQMSINIIKIHFDDISTMHQAWIRLFNDMVTQMETSSFMLGDFNISLLITGEGKFLLSNPTHSKETWVATVWCPGINSSCKPVRFNQGYCDRRIILACHFFRKSESTKSSSHALRLTYLLTDAWFENPLQLYANYVFTKTTLWGLIFIIFSKIFVCFEKDSSTSSSV